MDSITTYIGMITGGLLVIVGIIVGNMIGR